MKLISAVMPTRGRREWAAQAVESYLSQTYPKKELVICDDGDDPSFPNGIKGEGIRYHCSSISLRYQIPYKRNQCNGLAQGEIIVHWDSDDWSASDRIAFQAQRLKETGKAVTGFRTLLFFEPSTGRTFEYRRTSNYACGSSLMYRKTWWESSKFMESKPIASDNPFIYNAMRREAIDAVPGEARLIARIHDGNTSSKQGRSRGSEYVEVFDKLPTDFIEIEARQLCP